MGSANPVRVCRRTDIPRGGVRNFNIEGREIIVADTASGLVARSGVCKHNGFKLELCERNGDVIRCPLHGWEYRISSGAGIKPSWTQLDCYPLELRGDEVWVTLESSDEPTGDLDTSGYQW